MGFFVFTGNLRFLSWPLFIRQHPDNPGKSIEREVRSRFYSLAFALKQKKGANQ